MSAGGLYPDGAVCGFALTFELDLSAVPGTADLSARSMDEFGLEAGLRRLLALLEEERVRATFFLTPEVAAAHREVAERIAGAGHELALRGAAGEGGRDAPAEEQRAALERGLAALAAAGIAPRGHRAAPGRATWPMVDLLVTAGLRYDSSLMDDDRPYVLEAGGGRLVELPPHWAADDGVHYDVPRPAGIRMVAPASTFAELLRGELDAQRRHGGLVVATARPRLSGRASRA